MIHEGYIQKDDGTVAPESSEWVIESETGDSHKQGSLDDVFHQLDNLTH